MAKFMLVYRQPAPPAGAQPPSPEQMQAILGAWMTWIEKFRKSGQMVDAGDGLLPAGKVLHPGGVVTDGPYMESKEVLGGYSVLSVDTLDAALAIARECPAAHSGGTIEIRQLAGWV
jgi:hypothetical protein